MKEDKLSKRSPHSRSLSLVEGEGGALVLGEERKRDKLLRYAKHGTVLMAVGTQKIITRTLWWGTWGALVGVLLFVLLWWLGLFAIPSEIGHIVLLVVSGLSYVVAGAACWGHAGFWRGVGRFVLVLGIDNGWVVSLLSAILDRTNAILRRSSRIDRLMDKTELWVGDLPLARWEDLLKQASAFVIGERDPAASGLLHWLRTFVVERIERYMLRIVRKEIEEGHGGGVSMERVREVAFLTVEDKFQEGIFGLMNKQLLMMTGLFLALGVVPPLLAAAIRWGMAA